MAKVKKKKKEEMRMVKPQNWCTAMMKYRFLLKLLKAYSHSAL